jgi:hypothetical protein
MDLPFQKITDIVHIVGHERSFSRRDVQDFVFLVAKSPIHQDVLLRPLRAMVQLLITNLTSRIDFLVLSLIRGIGSLLVVDV